MKLLRGIVKALMALLGIAALAAAMRLFPYILNLAVNVLVTNARYPQIGFPLLGRALAVFLFFLLVTVGCISFASERGRRFLFAQLVTVLFLAEALFYYLK